MFYDILEWKNGFLGLKNKKFKKSKNWDFFKWVSPWFWSKMGSFFVFLFRQYWPGKCVLWYPRRILERENVFLSCKNKKFKKSIKLNVILWLCDGTVIPVCVPPIYKQRPKWKMPFISIIIVYTWERIHWINHFYSRSV